jgi:hypothetical protein
MVVGYLFNIIYSAWPADPAGRYRHMFKGHFMKRKWKIAILALTAVIAVGVVATYLFTIGPFGKPVLAAVNGEKIPVARFQQELGKIVPPPGSSSRRIPADCWMLSSIEPCSSNRRKRKGSRRPKLAKMGIV